MTGFRLGNNPSLRGARAWWAHGILFCVACNVGGWLLSLFGWVNVGALTAAIAGVWLGLTVWLRVSFPGLPRWRTFRLRYWFPRLFAVLVVLALIGGIIHPPNNYDGLNYRLPKIAHWLMAGRWEWIEGGYNNLNTRASGYEWVALWIISLTRGDGALFLINFLSFLALPGLVFSVLREFHVDRKVAWVWMWLLPAGYCFVLQAASIGNDLLPAVFALAAFSFGLRWRRSSGFNKLGLSLLACGMMTAVKPTTLPLLLPYVFFVMGDWRKVLATRWQISALVPVMILASFLPTAAINHHKCGDWTGAKAESAALGEVQPLVGLSGNLINVTLQNLAPPVFPVAKAWNAKVRSLVPEGYQEAMIQSFEPNGARFYLPDFQGEEWAGLGFGVTVSLLVAIFLAFRRAQIGKATSRRFWISAALFGIALIAYFCKAGMSTVARHVVPYYVFLVIPFLMLPGMNWVVRGRRWRILAGLAMLSAALLAIITPSRPLWPAQWAFNKLAEKHPSPFIKRVRTGYEVYANRGDGLGVVRDALPSDASTIGLLSYSPAPELPLWKPYMERRLIHVPTPGAVEPLLAEGVKYFVVSAGSFEGATGLDPTIWLEHYRGRVVSRHEIQLIAKEPAVEWWVVELGLNKNLVN